MQLFYNPQITKDTTQITFDKIESKHIVRVLRKKEKDILHITNGFGFLFEVKIIIASDKKCVAEIISAEKKPKPWPYYVHIAIAPTKNNDRIEWFLEKATEIGIDEITPIICSNSERRYVKIDRFEKIIQAAMKQSLKFTLPKINEPVKFNDFINQTFDGTICIAHCEPLDKSATQKEKKVLKSVVNPSEKTTILIGPEGDFSTQEITKALEKKWIPISLGESRLRTETAGLVAIQNISFINQ
ncbi:16S rRNA (uracil(1498)-N(3))-methyltransferase [Polaribacter glomeratus]|uniref:Ribosomal RNA small subunit methyltransferase E n=1 Tax=Polaribacter glomeratus TaxID=102 RepID=A0A2S7WUD5_9FLAO|nr:16S rRNA (uracil(1498)-N(3))-methyltransferase [Polaribacter glomeratus]PQJ81199.1 16S rRNA (uracil(1498)-N(3))-methyltransferase [Polaribacter glomeratus]TXD65756.1 16S rRNA (uracil(1498)-N(3))-methyltransferase [Polaribacter glomeratus]